MPSAQFMSITPTPRTDFALWLIIPVKPFGEGKSRLASVLSSDLRAQLSERWLTHVLTIATEWGRLAGIAVISRDPAVLARASALGALPIDETGDELNEALTQASSMAAAMGAEGVLSLPSDLPLLAASDLEELYDLALAGASVTIAPSNDGGTNALLLRPPHAIPFAFGEASFDRHIALATVAGLPHRVYYSATLALDIDHPEDLLLANG